MSTRINPSAQATFDQTTASKAVRDINTVKQQVANAPDHKVTKEQAETLKNALATLQTSQSKIQTDLRLLQASGQTGDIAHIADYMNALNNSAQGSVQELESNNDLDDALTANGSSAGEIHDLATQINVANAGNLNYANQVAPNSDSDPQGTADQANRDTQPLDGLEKFWLSTAPLGASTNIGTSATGATAATLATDIKAGNKDQAVKDLQSGYANYLAGTQQADSPALRQQFGEQVKNVAAGQLSDEQKGTLGQVVDGWSGHQG